MFILCYFILEQCNDTITFWTESQNPDSIYRNQRSSDRRRGSSCSSWYCFCVTFLWVILQKSSFSSLKWDADEGTVDGRSASDTSFRTFSCCRVIFWTWWLRTTSSLRGIFPYGWRVLCVCRWAWTLFLHHKIVRREIRRFRWVVRITWCSFPRCLVSISRPSYSCSLRHTLP